jgi:hypothetical protein
MKSTPFKLSSLSNLAFATSEIEHLVLCFNIKIGCAKLAVSNSLSSVNCSRFFQTMRYKPIILKIEM